MLGSIDGELLINVALLFLAANFLHYDLIRWKEKKSLWNGFLVVIMTACVALYVGNIYYGETSLVGEWILEVVE